MIVRLAIVCFVIGFAQGNYNYVTDLMPNRGYRLHWKFIDNRESIQFKVEVKSRGYFALGVSKSGGMANADIVSGFIASNGSAILHDRFATGQKMPEIVEKPNWHLVSGKRNETHLTFEFKRKCAVEDTSVDVPISKGTNQIIYAIGKSDPKDRTKIKYHGPKSRGTYELKL